MYREGDKYCCSGAPSCGRGASGKQKRNDPRRARCWCEPLDKERASAHTRPVFLYLGPFFVHRRLPGETNQIKSALPRLLLLLIPFPRRTGASSPSARAALSVNELAHRERARPRTFSYCDGQVLVPDPEPPSCSPERLVPKTLLALPRFSHRRRPRAHETRSKRALINGDTRDTVPVIELGALLRLARRPVDARSVRSSRSGSGARVPHRARAHANEG